MKSRGLAVVLVVVGLASAACNNEESGKGAGAAASASATPAVSPSAAPSAAPSASASAEPTASASAGPVDASAPNADAEAAQEESVVEELQAHHRHQQAGFAGFVMSAVETIGASPEQQAAVDTFRKEYRQKTKPLREANHAVIALVADGVAAGKLDHAKVDAEVAKAAAAAPAVQTAVLTLLGQLHATLRPEQRAALVDKVDAHFAVWRDSNSHLTAGSKPDHQLRRLAKDLSLTKDQVDKVQASLEAGKDAKKPFDATAAEAYLKAFDAEFAGEKFVAKKLPPFGPESGKLVGWGTAHMAATYEALAPVLTPEQRTTLADKLRQRGSAGEPKEKQ